MRRIGFCSAPLVLLVALLMVACAPVAVNNGTRVITGGNFVLHSEETYDGSLLILGGDSTLQNGSKVNGSLTVVGGNTTANGEINGDLGMIGGNVNLGPTAIVRGNVMLRGGNINRSPQAQVLGTFNTNPPFDIPGASPWFDITPASQAASWLFRTIVQAALAMLLFLLFPAQLDRTVRTILEQPVAAGGVGFLALILTPVAMLVLAVTIILIPLSILVGIVLACGAFFGWVSIGVETGRRLAAAFRLNMPPVLCAALGTVVLGFVELIPVVGWLATFLLSLLAIGAVALTRFGTESYTPAPPVPLPPALSQGSRA